MKLRSTFQLLFLLLFFSAANVSAQKKMLLLNGNEIEIKNYTVDDIYIRYKKANDKRDRLRMVERYDVFSIKNEDGTEDLIFVEDSLTFTIDEARNYIRGEQAAKLFYNKPSITGSAGIFGVGASLLSFYSLPVPMLYSVIIGRFDPPKMEIPKDYDMPYSTTEAYRLGYNKKARNIKIQQSLKWGYIGLSAGLAGLIIYSVTNP